MARGFRLFEKKRGHRRTGSHKLGTIWEAAFFGVLFVLGCGGLGVMFVTLVIPEWKANHAFARTTGVVRQTRIGEKAGDNGTLYRPEVQVEYQIDGETYRLWTYDIHTIRGAGYFAAPDAARAILERFAVGEEYVVYYDPGDANVAVLVRGSNWWVWLSLLVPASFVLIGGGGLAYRAVVWGKSAERRAAIAKQAAQLGPLAGNGESKAEFPYVPAAANVRDSPGTHLAFRLPVAGAAAWALWVRLAICLAWNGVVSIFVWVSIRGFLAGKPDWLLTIFLLPFVAIGVGLIVFFLRQLAVTTGIGPTLVEVSDQPFYPGGQYRLFLSQTGRLKMNWLELLLVCDEEATFRHGTDARTETRRVFVQSLLRREAFQVTGSAPFECECDLVVPAGAMHSFKSAHNQIAWKILVRGSAAHWPEFERSFPVIVYPSVGHAANVPPTQRQVGNAPRQMPARRPHPVD